MKIFSYNNGGDFNLIARLLYLDMSVFKKIGIAIGIIVLVLAILFYLQSQGFIKIFPTSEERNVARILEIDESEFAPPVGLSDEAFRAKIDEAYAWRETVLEDPTQANPWMRFGNILEFLNDHEGAIRAWKKVLEFQELNFVASQNIATNYQYFLLDFPKAEENYLQALTIRPDYTTAYQGIMDLYRFNLTEKKDLYEPLVLSAIANDSSNALFYYRELVDFYARDGKLEKAREYLDDVEKLKPQSAEELRQDYPGL